MSNRKPCECEHVSYVEAKLACRVDGLGPQHRPQYEILENPIRELPCSSGPMPGSFSGLLELPYTNHYTSYSLNSLKGVIYGIISGTISGIIKGNSRSLDYGLYKESSTILGPSCWGVEVCSA